MTSSAALRLRQTAGTIDGSGQRSLLRAKPQDAALPFTVSLHGEHKPLADVWRELEQHGIGCLYQSYVWTSAWCENVAEAWGEEPLFVVGRDQQDNVAFLLPFALTRKFGTTVLGWLGQGHSNYNLGFVRSDVFAELEPGLLQNLFRTIARERSDIAAVHLFNQPMIWDGRDNPFALLASQQSADCSYEMQLRGDFDALYNERFGKRSRSSLARKERKLGQYEVVEASTPAERIRILDVFLEQKSKQFAAQGISNVFADPAIENFYREIAKTADDPCVTYNAITIDDEIIATYNGMTYDDRFYLLTASLTGKDMRRWSPGQILIREQIAERSRRGCKVFDFGSGEGPVKTAWAADSKPLADSFMLLRRTGWPLTLATQAKHRIKRMIKDNPQLFQSAKSLRRKLRGGGSIPIK